MAIRVIDVNGSFARFLKNAPIEMRKQAIRGAQKSRESIARRMFELAPVGPDAPHMRDAIEVRGTQVGIFDPEQAAVALYNEYSPNHQPFMGISVRDEEHGFKANVTKGLQDAARNLSIGS
jgi:hypothetical protein